MIISKISRGIVVCIFTFFIIALGVLNIFDSIRSGISFGGIAIKLVYIVSLALCVTIYSLIKEKLSKKNVSKKVNLAFRYFVVSFLAIVIKILTLSFSYSILQCFVYSIFCYINGIVLKKIIYNISKSDILSIVGMFLYMFLPSMNIDFKDNITSYIMVFITLAIIILMEMLIDELKQIGIKNKKYIVLSVFIGLFVSFSMVFGINILFVWIIVGMVVLLCTSNMDRTHINFSNKFINMLRQRSKELLYRFERIYINKVLISLFIIAISAYLCYFVLNFVIELDILNSSFKNYVYSLKVTNNLKLSFNYLKSIDFSLFVDNLTSLMKNSKLFSLILIIYIVFIEFLNVALRRKYDTKSTIIKSIFVCSIVSYAIFGINCLCYCSMLDTLLILISIINTTNLYLNRDERIKLLNS